MGNNIVISAIGFNSPFGIGKEKYWEKINQNLNLDTSNLSVIQDYDPQKYLNPKGQKYLNKATLIYCNVAFQAIYERELTKNIEENPERVGLYDGSELSNLEDCFIFDLTAKNEGADYVSPMKAPNTIANAAASQMAIQAGIKGPNFSICGGATGSLQALDIARMHLNQNIVDYAIVAATEIKNEYQQSILEGEGRKYNINAPEVGVSLILERLSSLNEQKKSSYAIIRQVYSATQLNNETNEQVLQRLLEQIFDDYTVDIILISGGAYNVENKSLESYLKECGLCIPIIYPEKIWGDNDNAGGILGVIYAIGIFQGKLNLADIQDVNIENMPNNILVMSIDQTGTAVSVLLSK